MVTLDELIESLPENRQVPFMKLRNLMVENLGKNVIEKINTNAIDYHLPLSIFPNGDPSNSDLPLHIVSIASQKRYIGLYSCNFENSGFFNKLKADYVSIRKTKSCVGKGCIRFDKVENIPYNIISNFVKEMSLKQLLTIMKTK